MTAVAGAAQEEPSEVRHQLLMGAVATQGTSLIQDQTILPGKFRLETAENRLYQDCFKGCIVFFTSFSGTLKKQCL